MASLDIDPGNSSSQTATLARGGGIYADVIKLTDCVVSGNVCLGSGTSGGGIFTVGGAAHRLRQSLLERCAITGNRLTAKTAYGAGVYSDGGGTWDQDIFTGSLLYFESRGYNRIGVIDFSQMLVPVGEPGWRSLCRKHYPKEGDIGGVQMEDVAFFGPGDTTEWSAKTSDGLPGPSTTLVISAPLKTSGKKGFSADPAPGCQEKRRFTNPAISFIPLLPSGRMSANTENTCGRLCQMFRSTGTPAFKAFFATSRESCSSSSVSAA